MKKRLIPILFLLGVCCGWASAAVTVTATATSAYKNQVMNSSTGFPVTRQAGFQITGGTNNTLNYALSGTTTGVSLDCTSACPPTVKVTMPISVATCAYDFSGGVGSYGVTGGQTFTVTGTSTDDATKSATTVFQVCDTSGNASVDVEPSYNQAFQGQSKTLQSYVIGYANQNVTWSITTVPSGGNATLTDTSNRDTIFNSGTVAGRYVITATSVANGSLAATAIIYVSGNSLPRATSPNKTESTECAVDPGFAHDIEIGPGQAFPTLLSAGLNSLSANTIVRIHNAGANGSPTTFHEMATLIGTGGATTPVYICGVANASGELPVVDGASSVEASGSGALSGIGGFRLFNCNPTGTGYGLGSCGPDYFSITGIRFQNFNVGQTYFPNGGGTPATWTGSAPPACIWTRSGQHLHMEGLDMNNCAWGVLNNNNTNPGNPFANSTTGQTWVAFVQFMGGHINNFSFPSSFSTHALYIQGAYSLAEGNLIENPQVDCSGLPLSGCTYDNGNFIKMRGSDSIVRYNTFRGFLTGQILAYPDMADSYQWTSVDQYLGLPGDTTCVDSAACAITTNRPLIEQLLENQQSLMEDFAYGNVISPSSGINGFPAIGIGSYAAFNFGQTGQGSECGHSNAAGTTALCTPNMDHNGLYYFFNNTVDQTINGIFQTANNSVSAITATAQYFATAIFAQNNIFWNDANHNQPPSNPYIMNLDATHVATYVTNLVQSGLVTSSGTISGDCGSPTQGWGCYTNSPIGFAFSPSNPIRTITGLSGANFITTSTMPYNRATYAPQITSAAVGVGSTISLPAIAHMPIRFQPDPVNGYMVARVHPDTLGAVDASTTQPTISSVVVTPPSYSMSSGGATLFYTAQTTFSNGLTEDCTLRCIWGPASGTLLFNFYVERNIFGTNMATGTENAMATEDSTTGSSPLTIGGGAPTVVSVAILPAGASVAIGATQAYTCIATLSDSSTETCTTAGTVTWASGTPAHATINSSGVATGVAAGITAITATVSSVTSPSQTLSVIAAVHGSTISGTQTFSGTGTIH